MHRIVKSHLEDFTKVHELEDISESERFEKFVNYSLVSPKTINIDLEAITTGPNDDGIDGVAVIINEELISTDEDAKFIFESNKRNHEVEILFVQAKTSGKFDLGDFLKFKESVKRFVEKEQNVYEDDNLKNSFSIFQIVIKNVPKLKDGKPNISTYFVTTGTLNPSNYEDAGQKFEQDLDSLSYFKKISVNILTRMM